MRVSVFKPYSYGYVVDVRQGSPYVEVCPMEPLGFLDGEVNAQVTTVQDQGYDGEGNKYTVSLTFGNSLSARWLPGDTQRVTPPDVRVGERVMIYRWADSDQYYWRTMGLDNHLRQLETVVYAFSATPVQVDALNADNAYFFEISTHARHIALSTSKANGEPFAYTIQLDTGAGVFTVTDDIGNIVTMSSADHLIRLRNASDTWLNLEGRDATLSVPDTYTIQCKDYKITATNSMTETTKTMTTTASTSMSRTTTSYTLNASASAAITSAAVAIKAPSIGLTGTVTAAGGTMSVAGAATFAATVSVGAMLTAAQGTFAGMLTSMGKNVSGVHMHTTTSSGNPTSPPL